MCFNSLLLVCVCVCFGKVVAHCKLLSVDVWMRIGARRASVDWKIEILNGQGEFGVPPLEIILKSCVPLIDVSVQV